LPVRRTDPRLLCRPIGGPPVSAPTGGGTTPSNPHPHRPTTKPLIRGRRVPATFEAQPLWASGNSLAICAVDAFCSLMLMSARCDESAFSRAGRRVSARSATVAGPESSGGLLRRKQVTETVLKKGPRTPSLWLSSRHRPPSRTRTRALMRHSPAAECLCVSSAASSSRLVVPVFAIALYIWPSTVRTDTVNRAATSLFDRP
jgi:hypothetical protein